MFQQDTFSYRPQTLCEAGETARHLCWSLLRHFIELLQDLTHMADLKSGMPSQESVCSETEAVFEKREAQVSPAGGCGAILGCSLVLCIAAVNSMEGYRRILDFIPCKGQIPCNIGFRICWIGDCAGLSRSGRVGSNPDRLLWSVTSCAELSDEQARHQLSVRRGRTPSPRGCQMRLCSSEFGASPNLVLMQIDLTVHQSGRMEQMSPSQCSSRRSRLSGLSGPRPVQCVTNECVTHAPGVGH